MKVFSKASRGRARGAIVGRYDSAGREAQGYVQPYREQGGRASGMYGDTLGVNGAEARTRAQGTYFSDPVLQQQLALQQKNRGWASNARGGWGSGADSLAAQRVNLQNYGNWQNRLQQEGQQGYGAATQSGNYAMAAGAGAAGAQQGATGQLAGLYQNRAQTQNALAQNIISGIGAVGTFFGGRPAPQGTGQVYGSNNLSQPAGYPRDGVSPTPGYSDPGSSYGYF